MGQERSEGILRFKRSLAANITLKTLKKTHAIAWVFFSSMKDDLLLGGAVNDRYVLDVTREALHLAVNLLVNDVILRGDLIARRQKDVSLSGLGCGISSAIASDCERLR